jgi:uncharacterized membrane protein
MDVEQQTRISRTDMRRHLVDAFVPNVAFLIAYESFGVAAGVLAAVAAGLVLVVARLSRKHSPKVVFTAFGLVVIHATTVLITGEGRSYVLPWLVLNAALLVLFAASLLLRKPLSTRLSTLKGVSSDPATHMRVTAIWTGLWALHLLVGVPLYLADQVVALGTAHFVLGPPAVMLLIFLSWRLLRVPNPPQAAAAPATSAEEAS